MRAAEYLDGRMAEAQVFSWDMPGLVLAIANRQVLHARGDASEEHNRRLERVALRVTSRQVEMC
jgi:alpha-ketoglutarate-dependent taurine dioxygenase